MSREQEIDRREFIDREKGHFILELFLFQHDEGYWIVQEGLLKLLGFSFKEFEDLMPNYLQVYKQKYEIWLTTSDGKKR